MDKDSLTPWQREATRLHADCHVYKILKERWRNHRQASEGDFYVMDVGDWAVALALTGHDTIVLVRQFRFGSAGFSWELPAGVVDPGESPVEGGMRELYEESGYKGESGTVLGMVHPNPAVQRNSCHFVLVEGARRIDRGEPGPHESFEVREVEFKTLFGWARDGTITHGIVHAALFFLQDHLLKAGYTPSDLGAR